MREAGDCWGSGSFCSATDRSGSLGRYGGPGGGGEGHAGFGRVELGDGRAEGQGKQSVVALELRRCSAAHRKRVALTAGWTGGPAVDLKVNHCTAVTERQEGSRPGGRESKAGRSERVFVGTAAAGPTTRPSASRQTIAPARRRAIDRQIPFKLAPSGVIMSPACP